MSKIRIKNFGPIKEGYLDDNGWLDVKKVTVFIGNQGSGKSTVAKLISMMTWMEKAIFQGVIKNDDLDTNNRFFKEIKYQRIDDYFQKDTEIAYVGSASTFHYEHSMFRVLRANNNSYVLPKIMYVPAERNFLSSVDRPDKLKNLPSVHFTFNDEYDKAKSYFAKGVKLPISNTSFEYDQLNKIAYVVGEHRDYKLRLSEASSGYHSLVPLFLVSKNLSEGLAREENPAVREKSLEEQKKLDREIQNILNDKSLSSELRNAYLRQLNAKIKAGCFINIVEEPEQNLFPASQWELLKSLLEFNNMNVGNKLVMTTHSPYLVNYLTLAVKAGELKNKLTNKQTKHELDEVVPLSSTIDSDELAIYELNEQDGTIKKLEMYDGLPSDENELNEELGETNELFAQLLEIEQKL
jgi:predicted ATPase